VTTAAYERIDLNVEELKLLIEGAGQSPLDEHGRAKLHALLATLVHVTRLLESNEATLSKLRQLLLKPSTEKTEKVLENAGIKPGPKKDREKAAGDKPRPGPTPGHGRNGAEAYAGAERVQIPLDSLKPGDRCPKCEKGKVYAMPPGVLVRIVGQAPLAATVYELQKLRCNLCLEIFTATPGAEVGEEKYDTTAASMIALLKYGCGFPFYRMQGLQGNLGIPLPSSTQWDIMNETALLLRPVMDELIRQAAQGEVVYNDDTKMKILAFKLPDPNDPSGRTGVFTSGIVSTRDGRIIALYFSGRRHAGENLSVVLAHRSAKLSPPTLMCDGLSRNLPKSIQVLLANCLTHGRRKFVEILEDFPEPCRHVLESLAEVYSNDALTRQQQLTPAQRLQFHQTHSGPVMESLFLWLNRQLTDKIIEPNSGFGAATLYLLKRWPELTLFLRIPGAPLDNNLCERILKKAILHRKNALFYKTQNGANVGDLFMSLIHTCELEGINPFEYLTHLQEHWAELAANPQEWMPWNYRDTMKRSPNVINRP
jgi:transposase